MFQIILIVIGVVLVGFIILVASRSDKFQVTRSARFAAAPGAIFPLVNELRNWESWSPWAKLDPTAKNTYEGPPAGTGAAFGWFGNNKVGEGRMVITESSPNGLVRLKLEFVRPMKGTNDVEFTFKPESGQTLVTWNMTGKYNFVGKAVNLIINCDKMCAGQFDQGLAQMKRLAEAASTK